jgi:excisionase family DNA binding protein
LVIDMANEEQEAREPDDKLTTEEVGQELGVSDATIRRWIRDGRLPAIRVGQRSYRVRRADLALVTQVIGDVESSTDRLNALALADGLAAANPDAA